MAKKKKKVVRKKATKKKIVKVGKGQIPVSYTTTGGKRYKYNKQRDKDIPNALPPGKRVTNWGTTYYEKRVNRSDAKGSLTGERHYDTNSHNYNFTISGINKNTVLNKLYKDYGIIHSQMYQATTKAQKNIFKRLLSDVKKEIVKVKKLK